MAENKEILDLIKMLAGEIPDWHMMTPTAQTALAHWIREDRVAQRRGYKCPHRKYEIIRTPPNEEYGMFVYWCPCGALGRRSGEHGSRHWTLPEVPRG